MPNWVFNRVAISGERAEMDKFVQQAGKTPTIWSKEAGHDEDDKSPKLSFANFIAPPQEAIDSGEYHGTHGFVGGEEVGRTDNNWYEFNTREWGTKWDAGDVQIDDFENEVIFRFETAWSPPEPVFQKMTEMFPALTFDVWWEEEQGFGATYIGSGGNLSLEKEWDIPSSHQDYVDKDNTEGCVCYADDDVEEWYDDCPKPDGVEFEVVVKRTLTVTARDMEHAKSLVEEALVEATPIERLALGDRDPYTVTELDNGVELEIEEQESVTA